MSARTNEQTIVILKERAQRSGGILRRACIVHGREERLRFMKLGRARQQHQCHRQGVGSLDRLSPVSG
jgi:hypothetical protein